MLDLQNKNSQNYVKLNINSRFEKKLGYIDQ